MSNRLVKLVLGAKPFGTTSLRLVLVSLAEQVNETEHADWCFPSLQLIQERTEMGRRMVLYNLTKAKDAGWLQAKPRPGYGNAYLFDVEKLQFAQREKCAQFTRAYIAPVQPIAPVQFSADRGAISDTEGCNILLPNKEEQESNKKEQESSLPLRGEPVLFSYVSGSKRPKKPRAPKAEKREPDPRHTPFKAILAEYWKAAGNAIGMPWEGGEAGALGQLLSANPHLDDEQFRHLLDARLRSDTNHAKRPVKWLASVTDYAQGPLDKFGNPKEAGNGTHRKGPSTSHETRTDRLKSDAAGAYSDVLARIAGARPTGTAGPLG